MRYRSLFIKHDIQPDNPEKTLDILKYVIKGNDSKKMEVISKKLTEIKPVISK